MRRPPKVRLFKRSSFNRCYAIFLQLRWIVCIQQDSSNQVFVDIEVIIERHEQKLKTLERDMSVMKEVQSEIRSMNESLVTLANELKHANEHLARHERKIDEIDTMPKKRMQQIITAIIAALAGGLISAIIGMILV